MTTRPHYFREAENSHTRFTAHDYQEICTTTIGRKKVNNTCAISAWLGVGGWGWGGVGGVFLNVHEQYRDVVYLYSIREECFNKAVWHKPQASAALLEKKIKKY